MLRGVANWGGLLVLAVVAVTAAGIAIGITSDRTATTRAGDQALPGTTACSSTVTSGPNLRPPQPLVTLGSLPSSPFAVAATATHAFVSYPMGRT